MALPTRQVAAAVALVALMILWIGTAAQEDASECGDQLTELLPCLPFIEGSASTATPKCCSNAKAVVNGGFQCLCVLIKDRNNLGFHIDVDRAVTLPSFCNVPANISTCAELLKLPPGSPAAKEFAEFETQILENEKAKGNPSGALPTATGASSTSSGGGDSGRGLIRDKGFAFQACLLVIVLSI